MPAGVGVGDGLGDGEGDGEGLGEGDGDGLGDGDGEGVGLGDVVPSTSCGPLPFSRLLKPTWPLVTFTPLIASDTVVFPSACCCWR